MNWNGLAFILLLLSFPLITIGIGQEISALWWAGTGALAIGGLIPPIMRFVPSGEEKES